MHEMLQYPVFYATWDVEVHNKLPFCLVINFFIQSISPKPILYHEQYSSSLHHRNLLPTVLLPRF
jgi:hypothetical protein